MENIREINPFCFSGKFEVTRVVDQYNVANEYGENISEDGTGKFKRSYLVDAPHIKMYKTPYDDRMFRQMSPSGYIVFVHLLINLEPNTETINLSYEKFGKKAGISKNSLVKGIKDLKECNMITPKEKSVYWINPYYFFCGNKIKTPPEYPEAFTIIHIKPIIIQANL